jgi:hypothetical protein
VHSGRAGSHHDPIEAQTIDISLYGTLTGVGAAVALIARDHHLGLVARVIHQSMDIDRGCDIGAAMTDIDAEGIPAKVKPSVSTPNPIAARGNN